MYGRPNTGRRWDYLLGNRWLWVTLLFSKNRNRNKGDRAYNDQDEHYDLPPRPTTFFHDSSFLVLEIHLR